MQTPVAPAGQISAPDVGFDGITLPDVAFNPLMPPFNAEEVARESIIENLGVSDLGLDATPEQYAAHAEAFKDASINVLEEAKMNRERKATLIASPDGGYEIDYRKPVGNSMRMLDLSDEDIAAIGADLGLSGDNITTFKLQKKQEEVMEQNRLLTDIEQEFTRLKMDDLSFAVDTLEQQRKLLNDLVDEYDELYKQLGEE